MCEPVSATIAMVGAQGAQFGQDLLQAEAQKRVAARNREGATDAAVLSYEQIGSAETAEVMRARDAVNSVRREAEGARSQVVASAAEGMVTGQSVDDLLNDFERQEGALVEGILLNEEFARRRLEAERETTRIGLESRTVAATAPSGPDPIGAALSAGVTGYSTYQNFQLQEQRLADRAAGAP